MQKQNENPKSAVPNAQMATEMWNILCIWQAAIPVFQMRSNVMSSEPLTKGKCMQSKRAAWIKTIRWCLWLMLQVCACVCVCVCVFSKVLQHLPPLVHVGSRASTVAILLTLLLSHEARLLLGHCDFRTTTSMFCSAGRADCRMFKWKLTKIGVCYWNLVHLQHLIFNQYVEGWVALTQSKTLCGRKAALKKYFQDACLVNRYNSKFPWSPIQNHVYIAFFTHIQVTFNNADWLK